MYYSVQNIYVIYIPTRTDRVNLSFAWEHVLLKRVRITRLLLWDVTIPKASAHTIFVPSLKGTLRVGSLEPILHQTLLQLESELRVRWRLGCAFRQFTYLSMIRLFIRILSKHLNVFHMLGIAMSADAPNTQPPNGRAASTIYITMATHNSPHPMCR